MAISSQAPQECGEGSTTSARSPDRAVKHHERAATKHCTGCGTTKPLLGSFNRGAVWCKECINAYSKEHYQRRRQHVLQLKRAYRAANPEKVARDNLEWRAKNLDRSKSYLKAYRKSNRGKINALEAKRHAAKLQRTPPWANLAEIEAVYAEARRITAETGIRHSVDHIIPMRGKHVSGLHVAGNLRVIPFVENAKKKNKFVVDEIV